MKTAMTALSLVLAAGLALSAQTTPRALRTIEDGVLDQILIYGELPPASTVTIAVRLFTAADADLAAGGQKGALPAETHAMQGRAPQLLQDSLVKTLVAHNVFAAITRLAPPSQGPAGALVLDASTTPPPGALVLEGHFTTLDPGSQDKRRTVGFGAGKSIVAVAGTLKAADGSVLATFAQRRIGVTGIKGGDATKKMSDDASGVGEDVANFLAAWGTGKKLK